MSKINDKATVELFVNGEQAEAAMKRLTDKLSIEIANALSAGDKKKAAKLQRELDKVNKELTRTESAAKGVGRVLNNLENTPLTGLKNALKYLKKQLDATNPNTEEWYRLNYCRSILSCSVFAPLNKQNRL